VGPGDEGAGSQNSYNRYQTGGENPNKARNSSDSSQMGHTNRGKETVMEESEIIEDGDRVEMIGHVANLLNDDDSPTESELGLSLNTGTETSTSAMMPMLERGAPPEQELHCTEMSAQLEGGLSSGTATSP